jgi:aminomethyltransferase
MDTPLCKTPLFDEHVRLGARMVPFAGYEMPVQYSGVKQEHLAVRTAVGVFDVSHMGELWVRGPNAVAAVNRLITNDLSAVPNGKAVYCCCCNEHGMILDDLIVYRISDTEVLVVCNASNRDKIVKHFARELDVKHTLEDASDATGLLAVQGPKALSLLAELTGVDLAAKLNSFCIQELKVAGIPCQVARTGYTGEDGAELFCPATRLVDLFRALLEHGAPFGLLPAGLAARDTLRLEAKLPLYGNDIDETTHPLEAGLGWAVKLGKQDFLGQSALRALSTAPLSRRLVGFEMTGRGIARHGYPILAPEGHPLASDNAGVMGICTSGSPSPSLGTSIGLGYVPLEFSALGSQFDVDCRGKRISAVTAKTPFYKRAR